MFLILYLLRENTGYEAFSRSGYMLIALPVVDFRQYLEQPRHIAPNIVPEPDSSRI